MASDPITSWQIDGDKVKQWQTLFGGAPKSLQMVTAAMKLKDTYSLEEKLCCLKVRQHFKKQRHYFANKGSSMIAMIFPVVMYGCESLDYKESWAPKNWCFWTVVLEKTLESPLDCRRSNQSILKEISPEYSLEGLIFEAETPVLWPLDANNWLICENSDAGKDWRWEEKGMIEDEMVGWYHWLYGCEFE